MKKVHVIPHTHWDREWYFTTEESRIILVNNMEEIMEMLETNPSFPHYVLDGQTAILEDYFAVKPENKIRVKKLVKEGKLIIGPWYTQTDEMVVGGESIVRNLLYGIKDCQEFGDYMKIGYLPDSFGQSAQMPQILNGFGIDKAIFWRGVSERHANGRYSTEFNWESDEGSKVLVAMIPMGYSIGKILPEDEVKLKLRLDPVLDRLEKIASTDHLIFTNGDDQMPLQKNILSIIDKMKKLYPDKDFFLSKYENIFSAIKDKDFMTLKGEFLDGKYSRVHRSIYSSRADIKAANTRIENKITNILEPTAAIASQLGFEYPHKLIELIWKEMLKNHAHDSIGCCCTDQVHKEIESRFLIAEEKVNQLIKFYQRKIADSIATQRTEDRLVAYNLLPYARNKISTTTIITRLDNFSLVDENNQEIDFDIISQDTVYPGLIDRHFVRDSNFEPIARYVIEFKDEIPAMGYKTYFITKSSEAVLNQTAQTKSIDTAYYNITVNSNGTLNILDKKTNQLFESVLLFEDAADDGDGYDFSSLEGEKIVYSDDVVASNEITINKYSSSIKLHLKLLIPSNIENRKNKIFNSELAIDVNITVKNDSPIINLNLEIDNQAIEHRLRLLIPTKIASKFSVSDNQFGIIQRDSYDQAMDSWQDENWTERPDPIYPMLNFVGISNENFGVSVLTNSVREFEIIGQALDTIAITLFRSVNYLGKADLERRPGRPSGIKILTPDSNLIGKIKLELGLYFHSQSTQASDVAIVAREFLTPITFFNKMPYNVMDLNESIIKTPTTFSLLESNSNVILSTLKKAENNTGYILRYYNASNKEQEFLLTSNIKAANVSNLNEDKGDELSINNKMIKDKVKPNQVRTLLLDFND